MRRIAQFYRYTFYWGYAWSLRTDGGDVSAIKSLVILAFCIYLNLFAAVLAAGWLLHIKLLPSGLPKWIVAVALLAVSAPHYWYLIHGGRYRAIAAEFDAWDADRRWVWNRRVIFYIFASFVAVGLTAYATKNYPNPLHLPW